MDRLRTLLRYGVTVSLTAAEGKRVYLSNALALTLALLTAPYAVIFQLASVPAFSWFVLPLTAAYLAIPELNRAGLTRASRLLILALLNTTAALVALALGPVAATHMLLLALLCLPVVLFELRRWRLISVGVAAPLLLFLSLYALALPAAPSHAPTTAQLLNLSVGATAALTTLAAVLYFAVFNDRVERELEDAVECLEASLLERQRLAVESAEKSKFLANMSHELRTPLNAIIGYSELIREGSRARTIAEVEPDLQRIKAAGEHLLQLISEILDHSRLAAGEAELTIVEFPLAELLDQVRAYAAPRCAAKGLELLADAPRDEVRMRSDPIKLRKLLLALLSNAIKFTHEGSVSLDARIERDGERGWARFEVADTGIGISEDTSRSIFEAFNQGDMSFTREYGGTGLGLTVCKSFTEMLGGRIELRSERGRGSCFTVTLPLTLTLEEGSPGSRSLA